MEHPKAIGFSLNDGAIYAVAASTESDRPSVFKIDVFGHAVDFLGQQYDSSWFSDLTTMADGAILVWYVCTTYVQGVL